MAPKNKLFPWTEYHDGTIINQYGDLTRGYAGDKTAYFTRSWEESVRDHRGFIKALAVVPADYIVVLQDRYYRMKYAASPQGPVLDELRLHYNRHFDQRPYFQHQCYVFVTKTGGTLKSARMAIQTLAQARLIPKTARDLGALREFEEIAERFVLILQQETGIGCRLLTKAELMGTRQTMGLTEPFSLTAPPGSNPMVLDIDNRDGFKIGDQHVRVFPIADAGDLPAQVSPVLRNDAFSTDTTDFPMEPAAYLGHLLSCDHIYTLYFRVEGHKRLMKKLDKRIKRLLSLGGTDSANQTAQTDSRAYRDLLTTGEHLPVRMHANVMIWTTDKTALSQLQQLIVGQMMRIGVTPRLETLNALRLYAAAIPGNAGELPINHMLPTFAEQASTFAVTESSAHGSESPSSMPFVDRTTGIPLQVDLYDEPKRKGLINNFNKIVAGPSGSGKSVLMLYLMATAFRQGHHVMIVDIGGSYKALCHYLGGRYFAFGEAQALQLNPFLMREQEMPDTEKLESLIALLMVLWKSGNQQATRSEYIALSNILTGYYLYVQQRTEVFPCFNTLYEWLQERHIPGLQMAGVREKDFDWTNFIYVLRPYYRGGEYEHLLNAREDMDLLQQRFVVFELDAIRDHPILFPVVTVILMQLYMSKLRRLKGVRKIFVMDEAWKALKKPVTGEFAQYVFKTVRKFYGEAIVATQDIEDLVGSEIVKNAIINNADTKIILDAGKLIGRFDEFQSTLGLTEKDKTLLFSLNRQQEPGKLYKEFFVTYGNGHSSVYRLELPLEELLLYTTDESQRVKINAYAERCGGWWEGIKVLAADVRSGAVKLVIILAVVVAALLLPNGGAKAQIIDIADEIIKEALETADLKIQRLQTQTILLQNAEKALENTMTGDLLDDITGWVQQQENLFSEYYGELWQVKSALSSFSRVSQLIERQAQLVTEYQRATAAVQRDPHFSATEVGQMLSVYSGILNASIRNTGQLALVIQGFVTQMDDAGRLRIIDETAAGIDEDYAALQQYTQENTLLSLQRAKDENEIQTIKALYGL